MEWKNRKQALPNTKEDSFIICCSRFGICLLIWLLLSTTGCAEQQRVTVTEIPNIPRSTLPFKRGIGYWPTNYDDAFQKQVFSIFKRGAQIACIQIDDWQDRDENKRKHDILASWLDHARKEGLQTYIAVEPFNGDRSAVRLPKGWKGPAPNVGDRKWQALFQSYILDLVKRQRPNYLNMAVEANMYYRHHPEDWDNFRSFFHNLYREVKAVSPATRVFSSYQYEVLRGAFAGQTFASQWELFGRKELQQDLVGITSYPNFLKSPYDADAVPADYFHDLKGRTELPLFIAEVGFYSSGDVRPASTPDNQARFIRRLPNLFSGLNVEAVCWINMTDLPDIPALAPLKKILPQFFSLGLFDDRLRVKPAWEAWLTMKPGPVAPVSSREQKVTKEQVASTINLDGIIGIGSTLSTEVQGVAGAQELVWRYRFSTNPLAMLVHPSVSIPKAAQGIQLRLWSRQPTTVAIVLEESAGARYEARLTISEGAANTNKLLWQNFTLQKETRDDNNRLDIGKVTKLVLLDLSGFLGKKGENELRINSLQLTTP